MIATHDLRIRETVRIESPRHLSEVLTEASEQGTPVLPYGGGTCLGTGNVPEHRFLALDLSQLSGIDDYIPTDMTASFRAGTSLQEVKHALAENGQELPIDISDDDAGTIGGLVATGFAGASRLGKGTLKDGFIGCEYARGDGLLAKAGGMTVKNVSGFEISRLMHGSWGSLAVLTRVNLKVYPKPRADESLAWKDASLDKAITRHTSLMGGLPMATAIETIADGDAFVTRIRLQGREIAVQDYLRHAKDLCGAADDKSAGADWWYQLPQSAPVVVCGGDVASITSTVRSTHERGIAQGLRLSLPTGSARIEIAPDSTTLEQVASSMPGTWVVEGGTTVWKRGGNVWGPDRADSVVAQNVKQQFDPAGVLNRGRLFV